MMRSGMSLEIRNIIDRKVINSNAKEFAVILWQIILGDPGADSGGEGKSKRAEKYGTKKSKER